MGRVFIGTSGFMYPHWKGHFYPSKLAQKDWFRYYAKQFDTVELNVSFYRLPKKETFEKWRKIAGPPAGGFVFSVKGNRYITHIKRLKDCQEAVGRFFEATSGLKPRAPLFSETRVEAGKESRLESLSLNDPPIQKSGVNPKRYETADQSSSKMMPSPFLDVILWQLPPRMAFDELRLEQFLKILPKSWRHAFEFRSSTWLTMETFKLLRKYNSAIVFQDYPDWPITEEMTADFVYLRFHGAKALYSSDYSDKELKGWGRKIKKWLGKDLDVYAYFNNDALGYAVENAKALRTLVLK